MIDLVIRVKNPNIWDNRAKDLGLKEEVVTVPAVLDENGDVVTPAETEWVFKSGVHVDEIDTIWTTKPEYDAEGVETTPGVKAKGQHFNIRISDPALIEEWKVRFDEETGEISTAPVAAAHKSETARVWRGVEFVDISTVATPQRVWL